MKSIDLSGQHFGRLTVLHRDGWKGERILWLCRCDCGVEVKVTAGNLRSGNSQSCGCLNRERCSQRAIERSYKHGHSRRGAFSSEYVSWAAMHGRCKYPSTVGWENYGGRGITVCERWQSFENFLADMGAKPSPRHSIDRYPDNDGNYEPSNCRWATAKQQNDNRRSHHASEASP